jgi:4-amino-4-deoxy-L-arabinose transferase-like glycosyltransferase
LGAVLALLSKGPIGLIVPGLAIGTQIILKKQFDVLLNFKWIVFGLLVLIGISPMLLGLYQQYGSEGIRFFFWTQSFGRITGESKWSNGADITFLWHSTLWAFLPWPLFLFSALIKRINRIWKYGYKSWSQQEWIILAGFVLPMIALSLSRYQLPHYAFVTYPFAAILSAHFIIDLYNQKDYSKYRKWLLPTQLTFLVFLWILAFILNIYCFPIKAWLYGGLCFVFFLGFWILFFSEKVQFKVVYLSAYTILCVNLLMNAHVYPDLLRFQRSSVVGKYLKKTNIPLASVYLFKEGSGQALEFYGDGLAKTVYDIESVKKLPSGTLVYTSVEGLYEINKQELKYKVLSEGDDFHVTTLTLPFLNPKTRSQVVDRKYLIQLFSSQL